MALTGSFYGTTANSRIKPKIEWSAVQSVAGNYSDITATLRYSRTNTGYTTGGTWEGTIGIDTQTFSERRYIEITHNSNTVAITATARIYHDSYGKKTVTISATGGIVNPSSSSLKNTSISATVELETIPRESTISAVKADIGSRSTVVVSRKNDGFTHSIAYRFGTLSGYIDAEGNPVDTEVKLRATTVNFLLPESFYEQIPDDPSGVCTLTCRTYSGSTQIGKEQKAEFTATAAESLCKPIVGGSIRDVNPVTVSLTGDDSVLVRYASTAQCQIAAQAQKGATIVEKRIGGVTTAEDILEISGSAAEVLRFEAVDSRGYLSVYDLPVKLLPYIVLTNDATVQRTDPTSGNAVLTLQGDCWYGNFGNRDNTLRYAYAVNNGDTHSGQPDMEQNGTYFTAIPLSGLDYTRAHTIDLTVSDGVMTASQKLTVQKGVPVFDWGENDFQFNVPVELPGLTIGGVDLDAYIRAIIEGGSDG